MFRGTRASSACFRVSSYLKGGSRWLGRRAGCFAPLAPILTVALLIRGLLEALESLWSAKALVVGNRLAKRDIVRVSGKLLQHCIINRELILRLLQARIRVRPQKRHPLALPGF